MNRRRKLIRGGLGNNLGAGQSLLAWYDAADAAYLTLAGSAITQFLDRSGNGNHTNVQATSTARMTWTANQLNGRYGAVADGGDYYVIPSLTLADCTVIAVAKNSNTYPIGGGDIDVLFEHTGFSVFSANGFTQTANPIFQVENFGTAVLRLDGAVVANPEDTVVDTAYIYTTYSPDNASSTGTSGLFGNTSGGAIAVGSFFELLVYDRVLTAAEILQAELYLANKWGITLA